jgi:hypothetical protein
MLSNVCFKCGKVPLDLAEGRHALVIKSLVDERAEGHDLAERFDLVIKYLVDERAKLDAVKLTTSIFIARACVSCVLIMFCLPLYESFFLYFFPDQGSEVIGFAVHV